ncbi:MAG: winged helix-turn-helix domain-containing protein [Geodermatophilaceae bacterium]|nr:winged helix-turn-helix domain-containing protein [Geodermatophilaceae bacterium]
MVVPRLESMSAEQVRRVALRAQGFGTRRKTGPGPADIRRVLQRLGALQIDAVNVLVRSHYLPVFSRLGPYPVDGLDRLVYRQVAAFEYWAHAASIVAIELHPALRWRMDRFATHPQWAGFLARMERERPGYVDAVYAEVQARGPMTFSELTDPARRPKNPRYAATTTLWDRGSDGKSVLEYHYDSGLLAVAGRQGFNRAFDLAERVIPATVLGAPALAEQDGQRALVRRAGTALGVATIGDLADYFRLPVAATRARVRELVDAGEFVATRPQGWAEPGYLGVPSASARQVQLSALLSPFDSLLWDRRRTERVFGFRHSFELYVPADKRRFGYYVLPYVLGDQIVARVDLKADRAAGALLVPGAFLEAGHRADDVAGPLAAELHAMADWLGLGEVVVSANGDLAPAVAAELSGTG